MDILERLWEIVSDLFAGLGRMVERSLTSLFGSSNARQVRRLQPKVTAINALEPKYAAMTDDELRQQTALFRQRLDKGETLDGLLVEAFAVCREGGKRYLNMRHFDVQLLGGMVLHSGAIAEMMTGEGKTLVATLPTYLNALSGKGVHVVTVNDYLARRDMEWMGPLYMGLGLTVGNIQAGMESSERQRAYKCDITYGTNNEFGFDYLRDNMKFARRDDPDYEPFYQQVQGPLNFAVVDEVDNILIDEARTPLIISGPARDDVTKYPKADKISRMLKEGEHFEVKEKEHTVHLTEAGVREAEKLAGVESFYTAGNMEWPHLIDNSLKAHHLYKRDVNYVVQNGEVVIVDEFTGRLMPGRNWSDGLHQAVEAKEGVKVKEENQTLATITLQNFFKLYKTISGMTGTAMTEANELWKVYKLDVVAIPTNRDMKRINHPDVIYRTEREKFQAIVDEIERIHKWDVVELKGGGYEVGAIAREADGELELVPKEEKKAKKLPTNKVLHISRRGRPILVGTVSIEKSERLASMLERRGVPHEVLNAKHHAREAEIIAQAGRLGGVTIATNMAGRGTDIILGGNSETMAWAKLQDKYPTRLDVPKDEWNRLIEEIETREQMKPEGRKVAEMGGLHVIGTERHEARRIDLQLRGRCGRQGDPGSSRFYLSLEDDLMRIFAGEWVSNILTRLGMEEGEAIESKMVTRRIEGAQKKVEERHFESRKNLLEYDEVNDEQRKRVYGYRQHILEGANCKELILEMVDRQVEHYLDQFLDKDYGTLSYCEWASHEFTVELEPKDFRGMDFSAAERYTRDVASRAAEGAIQDAIEEQLPEDDDPGDWNWESLARLLNTRWNLNVRDRDLKKVGRDNLAEALVGDVNKVIEAMDCSGGAKFLEDDFGVRSVVGWAHYKFGATLEPTEIAKLDSSAIKQLVRQKSREAYAEKEAKFPVLAALVRFTARDEKGQKRYDRDQLAAWARDRFNVQLDVDELRNKQKDEIVELLVNHSRQSQTQAQQALSQAHETVEKLFAKAGGTAVAERATVATVTGGNGALESLTAWLRRDLHCNVPSEELAGLDKRQLEQRLQEAVEDRYRPEMAKLERSLLLQLLDSAWKDHLLSMDHLRQSVGLRGYAQVDPKVEYKREGMRTFETMWQSVAERVTDLVYRVEDLDDGFVGSTWKVTQTRHDSASSAVDEIRQQQQDAITGTEQNTAKIEPIRNREQQVGRNDPCPCGSGKKFKQCCMRGGRG